jgi:hypothetical protein
MEIYKKMRQFIWEMKLPHENRLLAPSSVLRSLIQDALRWIVSDFFKYPGYVRESSPKT